MAKDWISRSFEKAGVVEYGWWSTGGLVLVAWLYTPSLSSVKLLGEAHLGGCPRAVKSGTLFPP